MSSIVILVFSLVGARPSETSLRFKSSNSYHANDTYLASFQTKSEASPELLTLARKISKKEWPRGKQHQQFVFRYGIQTVAEKQPHRTSRFKLAYVENTRKKDKLGFGPKSSKKAKNYYKKTEGRFSLCLLALKRSQFVPKPCLTR